MILANVPLKSSRHFPLCASVINICQCVS